MNTIKNILIPTDFSSAATSALHYALNLIDDDESVQITLLHVSEENLDNKSKSEFEKQFKEIIDRFQKFSKVKNSLVFQVGAFTETILEAQRALEADLILIGTKGANPSEDATVTNTSRLVIEADCPVLVVPQFDRPFAVKNIALALGRNEIDDSFALSILHDIARKFDAGIHVLTIDNEKDSTLAKDKNDAILEYYLETLNFQHAFPKNADIEEGIAAYIKDNHIDMLAILPRNHAKKSNPSEGRLTRLLTLHTEVPLLAID